MAADVKISPSPHPRSHPTGRGGIFSIAESVGPADHPTTVISTSAPSVPQTMMASDAETSTLPFEDADGDLLARPATSVTQRSARPISHLCSSSFTHTACTQAGASSPILRVHLKKLMCMERKTAGGDSVLSAARVGVKDADGDLLARPATSATQRSARPISHLRSSFFTHTACTQAGALSPILRVHLKKLMCMERKTAGGDLVLSAARVGDGDLLAFPATSVIQRLVSPITHLYSSSFTHTTCTQAGALTPILSAHLKKLICMEGETERVDSVRLAKRGYSLVWGEEGIMQDRGVCLDRGVGIVGSLRDGYD